jgi:hypothetical protein
MEKRYKLLYKVLEELHTAGVLEKFILVGSWCHYFYQFLFDGAPEIPLLRTTDIDFLVPNPVQIERNVDVSTLLNNLGFDSDFDYHSGLIKYVHPDLEIQFITPAIGRGKKAPYEIKKFNINAEGLRYLTLLQENRFPIIHNHIKLWIPEPEAYILHKILISQKRKDEVKRNKDLMSAKEIGEFCLTIENRRKRIKSIFMSLPLKWRKNILNNVVQISPQLHGFLQDKKA